MKNPAKHRLHAYEAGWLTLLVQMGVATKQEAREAMARVAQRVIDDLEAKREKRRASRNRRRKRGLE